MNILDLINSPEGKGLLAKLGHKPRGKIVYLKPSFYIEHLHDNVFEGVFFSGNAVLKLFDVKGFPHYPLRFLTSPATFNPTSGAAFPVDGMARVVSVNESFSLVRAESGNQAFPTTSNTDACAISSTTTSNQFASCSRGFFVFDTSGLTASAHVTAATFSLYVTAKSDGLGSASSVSPIQASLISTANVANADYQGNVNQSTLQGSAVTISGITTSAYLDMVLNATGISNVSLTGATQLGMRMESDRANSAPTWASAATASITVNYADNGTNIPKLVVTFTLIGGALFYSYI